MFLKISVVILFTCYFSVSLTHCWDIAVTYGQDINLFTKGSLEREIEYTNETQQFTQLKSLTYDPLGNRLFAVKSTNDENYNSIIAIYLMDDNYAKSFATSILEPTIIQKNNDNLADNDKHSQIWGIAFDSISNTLFWTEEATSGKIMKMIMNGKEPMNKEEMITFDKKIPYGIAVASCERLLFWTTKHPTNGGTIERSDLSGHDKRIITFLDLQTPYAVTVDHTLKRIFWTDDRDGVYFQIESADFDGNDRQILLKERYQSPNGIAVTTNEIFWIDWNNNAVWSLPKNNQNEEKCSLVHKFPEKNHIGSSYNIYQIQGITSSINETKCLNFAKKSYDINNQQIELQSKNELTKRTTESTIETVNPDTIPFSPVTQEIQKTNDATEQSTTNILKQSQTNQLLCINDGVEYTNIYGKQMCRCKAAFTGLHCEIPACHNFCIHGKCEITEEGYPKCNCNIGYRGLRCEIDMCTGFCLNNGKCSFKIDENGNQTVEPECTCANDFVGQRCEQRSDLDELCRIYCEQNDLYKYLTGDYASLCRCHTYDFNISSSQKLGISNPQITPDGTLLSRLHDPIVLALIIILLILTPTCMALLTAVCWLRKRPRIKRRIIVNKNITPLTCRPVPQPDQCEITIENCCNMNICETPCFEPPQLRTSKSSKTDEKKTLLANMENNEDLY